MLFSRFTRLVFRALPPPFVRAVGRLQFKHPAIGKALRSVARRALNGEGTIVRGVGEGLKFDPTGGFPGMVLGTTEPREQALLDSNLKIGGVFYDIGANIGFYATLAGRLVGPDGRVYAFEPHPQTAQRCRENASRNGFQHVEIVQAAVSSFDGSSPLFLGEGSTENNISHEVADRIGPSVTVITVDEWRLNKNARLPTLVLIDAEGQEIEVLKGMRSTIVAAKPVLMIEVHWLGESFTNFVRSELEPLGYRFSTYDGKVLPTGICRFHALGIAHR